MILITIVFLEYIILLRVKVIEKKITNQQTNKSFLMVNRKLQKNPTQGYD